MPCTKHDATTLETTRAYTMTARKKTRFSSSANKAHGILSIQRTAFVASLFCFVFVFCPSVNYPQLIPSSLVPVSFVRYSFFFLALLSSTGTALQHSSATKRDSFWLKSFMHLAVSAFRSDLFCLFVCLFFFLFHTNTYTLT